jgi:hypothetical protein
MCAAKKCSTRDLQYSELKQKLVKDGVYLEN